MSAQDRLMYLWSVVQLSEDSCCMEMIMAVYSCLLLECLEIAIVW